MRKPPDIRFDEFDIFVCFPSLNFAFRFQSENGNVALGNRLDERWVAFEATAHGICKALGILEFDEPPIIVAFSFLLVFRSMNERDGVIVVMISIKSAWDQQSNAARRIEEKRKTAREKVYKMRSFDGQRKN